MRHRLLVGWAVFGLLGAIAGCGSSGTPTTNADHFGWVERSDQYARPGEGGFSVRWSRQLTDRQEARYLPVELSGAAAAKISSRISGRLRPLATRSCHLRMA